MQQTPTAGQLWTVLARCYKTLSHRVEAGVAASGLCLTDFMILEALLHKGPLTITEIQSKILLASGSMTAAVDRLERMAAIVRRGVPGDRRARRLELTDSGRHTIELAYQAHKADFEELIDTLDPAALAITYTTLKQLGLHTAEQELTQ